MCFIVNASLVIINIFYHIVHCVKHKSSVHDWEWRKCRDNEVTCSFTNMHTPTTPQSFLFSPMPYNMIYSVRWNTHTHTLMKWQTESYAHQSLRERDIQLSSNIGNVSLTVTISHEVHYRNNDFILYHVSHSPFWGTRDYRVAAGNHCIPTSPWERCASNTCIQ